MPEDLFSVNTAVHDKHSTKLVGVIGVSGEREREREGGREEGRKEGREEERGNELTHHRENARPYNCSIVPYKLCTPYCAVLTQATHLGC